jgi:hypothetical protein
MRQEEGMDCVKHLRWVTRQPVRAATITVNEKLTFVVDVLKIFVPIVTHKDPNNPAATTTTTTT